jgi:group I intron endonuclease
MGKPIIGVYKISNTLCPEGKYYIGYSCNIKQRWQKHKSTLRGGCHRNIRMQRAYEKYGSECFTYEILQVCETEEEAKNVELSYLEDLTIRDKLYNLHYNSSGGDTLTFHPDREQIIKKSAINQKKRISELTPEEYKRRFCTKTGEKNGMYGRTHTDEVKRLFSEMHKGNTYCLGKKASQETKDKLSVIARQRLGEKNPFFGKHHSEETKQKLRESRIGNIPTNARKIVIDRKTYISATDAGRQLNVCTATILHRIKSPNPKFANYFYADSKVLDDEPTPSLPLLIVDDIDNREV